MPASAAARATFTSGTAAPARSREPSSILISPKPRPRRITTPSMPPSRTSRFEPSPMMVTGMSAGVRLQEIGKVGLVGRRIEHFRRAARPEPGEVLERRLGLQPPAQLGQAATSRLSRSPRSSPPPCCASLFGRGIDPIGDGAGAETRPPDRPDLATEAMVSTSACSSSTVSTLRVAVTAQARGELVAVDAGDRRLARRIDRRDDRRYRRRRDRPRTR